MKAKLTRKQLVQAVIVILHQVQKTSWIAHQKVLKEHQDKLRERCLQLETVKAAIALIELEHGANTWEMKVYERHVQLGLKTRYYDSTFDVRLKHNIQQHEAIDPVWQPPVVLGAKIQCMADLDGIKKRVNLELDAIQVQAALENKDFKLDLKSFMARLGVDVDVDKLTFDPVVKAIHRNPIEQLGM